MLLGESFGEDVHEMAREPGAAGLPVVTGGLQRAVAGEDGEAVGQRPADQGELGGGSGGLPGGCPGGGGRVENADREGFKQLVRMVISGLSDLKAEVDLMVAENDLVAARVLAKGIHSGPYMGIPATGNPIQLSDWHYWRFGPNGQIVEHWNQYNALEVMHQLGVIPRLPDLNKEPKPGAPRTLAELPTPLHLATVCRYDCRGRVPR